MMKSLALLVLLFLSPLAAAEESWPLKFSAGPEWDIQSQGDGIDFFSFTRPKGENILFTLYKWPTKGGPEQIPVYVKRIADSFSESMTWFTFPGMAEEKEIDQDAPTTGGRNKLKLFIIVGAAAVLATGNCAAFGGIHGRCRVHRAEILRISGPCDEADAEAVDQIDRLGLAIVSLADHWGIEAYGRRDAPGVYVGESKLASIGLRIRRGCSYHGMALNVNLDLEPFSRINPCGYRGMAVTRLADLGVSSDLDETAALLERFTLRALGLDSVSLSFPGPA